MKKLKLVLKRIVIAYLIVFVTFAGTTQSFAKTYDSACGEYVSKYAVDFINKYGSNSVYQATAEVSWSGGSFGSGTLYCCCTSGVKYMYELALGVNLYDYGYSAMASDNFNAPTTYWQHLPLSEAKPGDILVKSGHVEMYIGNGQTANFGSSGPAAKIGSDINRFSEVIRLNGVDVNPNGVISSSSDYDEEKDSIYGANGFIYQGVATLSGYESGGTLGKWLFDTLLDILDWIIGILTYLIRIVIVGWVVIVERVFIDGIVNLVTGVNNTSDSEEETEDTQTEEGGEGEEAEEPVEPIGDPNDPEGGYVGSGVQGISNIGSKTQITTSSEANVTVENIVFNRVPILDANFFNFETALTTEDNDASKVLVAQLDKGGIVYLLKTAIATWYYVFRIMAVAVMLIILIYLGIRLSITTAAEGKAVYKEMLIGWVAGFILLFVMHYIMYSVLLINEGFVNWIASTQVDENGDEISLYETVRSKAYEIKASTGWSGMIMYIILVYYAVKFLLIYLKRYFTIAILAVFSPVVALSYAVEKINKNGKNAAIFGTWLKDFIYTALLQSVHALIYVVFIGTALKLTEESLMGIALSLVFLHFMAKAEGIFRKIMAFSSGADDVMDTAIPSLAKASIAGKSVKDLGSRYVRGINKTVLKPVGTAIGTGASRIGDRLKDALTEDKMIDGEKETKASLSEAEERKAQKEKEVKAKRKQEVARAVRVATDTIGGVALGIGAFPGLVIDPTVGLAMFAKSADLFLDAKNGIGTVPPIRRPRVRDKKRYTFNGMLVRDSIAAREIMDRLDADGVEYTVKNGNIKAGQGILNRRKINKKYLEERLRRRNLGERILMGGAGLATGTAFVNRLKRSDNNVRDVREDIRNEAKIRLYSKAEEKEKAIVRQYKDIKAMQDAQLDLIEKIDPVKADRLRAERDKQIDSVLSDLVNPVTIDDVSKAVSEYEKKAGIASFGSDLTGLDAVQRQVATEQYVQGVTAELNKVFAEKQSKIRVGEQFTITLKNKLGEMYGDPTLMGQRATDEEPSIPDQRSTTKNERGRSSRGGRDGLTREQMNDPNFSRNAPQQNGGVSPDNIVDAIRSSAKAAGAVEVDRESTDLSEERVRAIESVASKIVELEDLNTEASELGDDPLYDIDEVLEKLKDL